MHESISGGLPRGRGTGASRGPSHQARFPLLDSLLADLAASGDDAVTVWDLDGYILRWNRGAEELYGYTQD